MTTTAETKLHVRMTPGKWKMSATCFRKTIVAVGSIAAVLCCAEPSPAADGVLEGTVNDVDVVDRDGQVVANAAGGGALGVDGGLRTGEAGRAQLDMDGHTVRVGEQTQAFIRSNKNELDLQEGVMFVSSDRGFGRNVGIHTPDYKITAKASVLVAYKPGAYMKVTCIEGTARISLKGVFAEFVNLTPGQMLVASTTDKRLPEPVEIDLKRLVDTSRLIRGDGLPGHGNETKIATAVGNQAADYANGDLLQTPFFMADAGTNLYLVDQAQQAQAERNREPEPEVMEEIVEEEEEEEELSPLEQFLLAFRSVPLDLSQSLFGSGGSSGSQLPPALARGDAVILESPGPATLSGNLDFSSRANRAAFLLGSMTDFTIAPGGQFRINRPQEYVELFAGDNLTLGPGSMVDVSASSETTETSSSSSSESSHTSVTAHGLTLSSKRGMIDLNGASVYNQTGPILIDAGGALAINSSTLSAVNSRIDIYAGGTINIGSSNFLLGEADPNSSNSFNIISSGGNVDLTGSRIDVNRGNGASIWDWVYVSAPNGTVNVDGLTLTGSDELWLDGQTINLGSSLSLNDAGLWLTPSQAINVPSGFSFVGDYFYLYHGSDINSTSGGFTANSGVSLSGVNITVDKKLATAGADPGFEVYSGSASSGAVLAVTNSTQLSVLASSTGGITLDAQGLTDLVVDSATLTDMGSGGINIYGYHNMQILNSQINAASNINVSNYSAGGWLLIGGSNFNAGQMIALYSDSSQGIRFTGNTQLNAPSVSINAANGNVQVDNGAAVTSNGSISVNAMSKLFNLPGYGTMDDNMGPVTP